MPEVNTTLIIPEFKELVAKAFNVAGFIDSIKREYDIDYYDNGSRMFEWILRYNNLHKIENFISHVHSYKICSGVWDIPLLIDMKSKIAFIFMKENNLNRKRNEIYSAKYNLSKNKPPHYAIRLSELNKSIAKQLFLALETKRTAYEIIKSICPSIENKDVPSDLKLMIVTLKDVRGELFNITAGFYDSKLMEIYKEDWSEYIDHNYSSVLDNKLNKNKIIEINNKIIDLENSKEDLTEFIDDENEDNKNEENK